MHEPAAAARPGRVVATERCPNTRHKFHFDWVGATPQPVKAYFQRPVRIRAPVRDAVPPTGRPRAVRSVSNDEPYGR